MNASVVAAAAIALFPCAGVAQGVSGNVEVMKSCLSLSEKVAYIGSVMKPDLVTAPQTTKQPLSRFISDEWEPNLRLFTYIAGPEASEMLKDIDTVGKDMLYCVVGATECRDIELRTDRLVADLLESCRTDYTQGWDTR